MGVRVNDTIKNNLKILCVEFKRLGSCVNGAKA